MIWNAPAIINASAEYGMAARLASLLFACLAQSALQLLFLFAPTRVLGLQSLFQCGALCFDGACSRIMLPFAFFEGCLRLGDNLRAALTLPCPGDLFLPALVFTPSLLPLERKCGLAGCRIIGRPRHLVLWFRKDLLCSGVGSITSQVRRQVGMLSEQPI
jgi:hypothetical protein